MREKFEEIGPGLYFLKIPFGPVWTGVTLVTGKENCLIDSGATQEDVDTYILPALEELDIFPGDIMWLLNTHCHGDHIGGHWRMVERMRPQVAAYALEAPKLLEPGVYAAQTRMRFPDNSPKPQSTLRGVHVDRVLSDGEIIAGRLQLVATPGHDDDCVCWFDLQTKTLITGDSLQGNGTICQGIGFYKSKVDYCGTLKRLLAMDIETILCGHDYDGIGWLIRGGDSVRDAVRSCQSFVEEYDRYLRQTRKKGVTDTVLLAQGLIHELGCGQPEHLFMALYTVSQHMEEITGGQAYE